MQQLKELAIVLRAIPFEERHQMVTALTEHYGKISAMARNSVQSRRFGSGLQPFTASEWTLQKKDSSDVYLVLETEVKREFQSLRGDLVRLSAASVFSEIMIRIAPEGNSAPELFKLHSNALVALEECTDDIERGSFAVICGYLMKCLQWMGSQPILHQCLGCAKNVIEMPQDEIVSAQVDRSGWFCKSCTKDHDRSELTAGAIRDALVLSQLPIRQASLAVRVTSAELSALFTYLEALLIYHVPGFDRSPIKSLKLLGLKSNLLPD